MAVYTDVSDEELTEFLSRYDVGRLVSVKGIAEGVENTNYLIHTTEKPLILTLYEKRVAEEDLPFFLGLMEHLAAGSVPCPTPVRDRDGKALSSLAGRSAALITFLDGFSIRRPLVEHCSKLGSAIARLHLAGQNFAMHRKNSLSIEGWGELVRQTALRANECQPGLAAEIAEEYDYLSKAWPSSLPSGVIHADLFPDNVFFLDDEISGLIDFYFACNDFFAYDIAICMNSWCFEQPNMINVTKARALLRGYSQVRQLGEDEKKMLPLLARGASLRFLLTRLYDWFNTSETALVKPKDPLEYRRKLRFHQLVKSVEDYGL